jgi:hypothetical protein
MFATLGFAALRGSPPTWCRCSRGSTAGDSWRGIGDVVTGMNRQGYDLALTQYPDAWRCTFYMTGREHSLTSWTGSAWEKTAALAVQRAAARSLDRMAAAE